jgi:DNA-binding GntR family transcriptional regulator
MYTLVKKKSIMKASAVKKKKNLDSSSAGSAWETAYTAIRDSILNMTLKPGEMISELTLSKELGISRTPIREAFKKLEQEGLIVSQNRRKRVYILTIGEIEEIFDLKCAVEGHVALLAAERKTPEQEDRLKDIMDRMGAFPAAELEDAVPDLSPGLPGDPENHRVLRAWLEIDEAFHDLLYEMARNSRARDYIHNLNRQWHRLRMGINAMEGRIEKSITEHLELGEKILSGRGEEARDLMVRHLGNLKRTIVSIMNIFHFPAGEK